MQRVSVIGTSGSGKTTLARDLAARMQVPHIELDALHWGANWTPVPPDVFQTRVTTAIAGEAWTMCGNYGAIRDLVLARADTIIWLDYSMSTVLGRTLWRTFLRCWKHDELWSGNRESFYTQLFTRDSIILWVLNTWRKRRRDYPKMLRQQAALGKRVLRFRSPDETARWLQRQQANSAAKPSPQSARRTATIIDREVKPSDNLVLPPAPFSPP